MSDFSQQQHISNEQLRSCFSEIYRRSDQLMMAYLLINFAFGLFLATFYDTWLIAVVVGGLSLLAYFSTKFILPQSGLYQYVGSAVAAVFSAQFIYQMHGLFEMHFWVFLASLILITYQRWTLQLPLIILVVIHHAGFAYLQYTGMKDIYFTQMDYMTLSTFLFHGMLAAAAVFLSGYWSYDFRKKTIKNLQSSISLENQLLHMKNNISFAEQISQGNLKAEYEIAENDEIGQSLINMRDGLLLSFEKEQQEKFKNIGLTEINEILRNNMNDVESLCRQVISKTVKYLKANQGAVFITEGEDENDLHLSLKACYAYDKIKFINKKIYPGEGLLGQAFLEKDTLFLTEVPENYVHITSGLGTSNPRCVILVPLKSNDEVVGIIEIALFRKLESFEISFLEKLAESIASTIIFAKINERTRKLLENSSMQTEMMRAQEEEMRQNMEELTATQEEMNRKEAEIQEMLENALESEKNLKAEIEHLKKQLVLNPR